MPDERVTPKPQRTMTCREFLERYSEYDDSLIPAPEADRFRQHMEQCPSCARYDRVLRKGRMLARQLPRPEPSADFIPRLQRRLLQQRPRRRPSLSARLATGLAAVTVLMAAVSAVRLMEPGSAPESAIDGGATTVVGTTEGQAARRSGLAMGARAPFRLAAQSMLPVVSRGTVRAWPVTEVAPAGTASYSPLETGPPAYRAQPSPPEFTDSDHRALD